MNDPRPLPSHIEDTARSVADLHAEHRRSASGYQRIVDSVTAAAGSPRSVGAVAALAVLWIGWNVVLGVAGRHAPDPPPFSLLQTAITVTALLVTLLILTTQRRENELAEHRAQLTLQIALVAEQKMAKLIELVIRQRADNPLLDDHHDEDAAAMSEPANAEAMLQVIRQERATAFELPIDERREA